jgi:hypothetical protein
VYVCVGETERGGAGTHQVAKIESIFAGVWQKK